MLTITLICYVTASWSPPLEWTITKIENRSNSAAVYLSRVAKDGETLEVPSGCSTEEARATGSMPYWWGAPNNLLDVK